jgi:pilus assembly protein CpaC
MAKDMNMRNFHRPARAAIMAACLMLAHGTTLAQRAPAATPAPKPATAPAPAAAPAAAAPAAAPAPAPAAAPARQSVITVPDNAQAMPAVQVPATASPISNVTMFLGEVKTLPAQDTVRVAVGNGKVINTTLLETGEILVLGESVGDTSLFIWSRTGKVQRYRVRVTPYDTDENFGYLAAMVKDIPGVQLMRSGETMVVTGSTSKVNMNRLAAMIAPFRQVVNAVREEDVTMKKMVYLKVQILEMRKNALENLGVDWQTNIAGPAAALTADVLGNRQFRYAPNTADPTFTVGTGANQALSISAQPWRAYLGLATSISSRINLAVTNGDAWVLAAPELSTRSGGESKFLAGGQVPLPTVSATGQSSVMFKDYGIKLNFKPVADDQGNISAGIETEVSSIDASVQVSGIPGFLTRQTNSEINVRAGQTIVISGLVNQELSNSINKMPILGDVPVLGQLFRSTNFRSGRSDLVVFVTPFVHDPSSTLNQERVEKAKDMRERFENFVGRRGIVE